ncbi:hypothetical protein B4U79_03526 [Dinothrombium tinctorium]|uniref:J domain-containing protein n=1 Tax=Dinothrombium tinctorium TaxID=1965070 RepID=A0A3S3P2D3_9ACAR|nr:hypothetical protein B4U79_04259 [Dinothrombium tinctorium]RWS03882.1 hypothetical protein B4U79_01506 [Dinothrombium tinctorium]RWS04999.1 hypothetical protein B4U79_03526 [Dinothrombium tinctorium]
MSFAKENGEIVENYYAFLNVERNATNDEIIAAYRRLSRLFHPDKHHDEKDKKEAEILFNRAKKAYEVLIDPHKRAIYDTLGIKGLETEGWAVVPRTKTPQEIREEFERLQKEKEERYIRSLTNPRGAIVVGINATDLFERNPEYIAFNAFGLPSIEVTSLAIKQSIDLPLDTNDTSTLTANLSVENGVGSGSIIGGFRRVFSPKTWGEVQLAAGQGPLASFKVFRTVARRNFFTANGYLHFVAGGIRPGTELVLSRQLNKHAMGYLTWKVFPQSFMNTAVVWSANKNQVTMQLQIGIPICFAMVSGSYSIFDETKIKGSIKGGSFGAYLEYGCETKVSEHSIVGASMTIGVPKGVTLKLKLNRANQTYLFSLLLADEIIPEAIFYGTVIPFLTYYCVKKCILDPYKEREKEKKTEKAKKENASRLAGLRKEAEAAVSLMTETYNRIKEQEVAKSGLIIIKALYGKADIIENFINAEEIDSSIEVIDVRVALQCLVKDSSLILTETSKANFPGFYDPCLGEEKKLYIKYEFRNVVYEVFFRDEEKVRIPS